MIWVVLAVIVVVVANVGVVVVGWALTRSSRREFRHPAEYPQLRGYILVGVFICFAVFMTVAAVVWG